jgi:hypothetical protein
MAQRACVNICKDAFRNRWLAIAFGSDQSAILANKNSAAGCEKPEPHRLDFKWQSAVRTIILIAFLCRHDHASLPFKTSLGGIGKSICALVHKAGSMLTRTEKPRSSGGTSARGFFGARTNWWGQCAIKLTHSPPKTLVTGQCTIHRNFWA